MTLSRIMVVLAIIGLVMVLASYKYVERDAADTLPPEGEPAPLREESNKWVSAMGEAVVAGDEEAGHEAERHLYVTYDDVQLLARYLEAVRRPGWSDNYLMMAGEVVINRMRSPEFAGTTVRDVLFAQDEPGVAAFAAVQVPWWDDIQISRRAAGMAMELLLGVSVLRDPLIVYIGQTAKTWGYELALYDNAGGCTYLCRTAHPEVYDE